MSLQQNKGGENPLAGEVIFIVLNVSALVVLIIAISRVGSTAPLYEEAYAKQIALLIDAAKPGTTLTIDVSEILQTAQKNKVSPEIKLNCERNEVFVKATAGKGYHFTYFTEIKECSYSLNVQQRVFTIKI